MMKLKRIPFETIPVRESLPELSSTIIQFRMANGLSQGQLAELAGIATISVARIEQQVHVCRQSTWEAIAYVMAQKQSIPAQGELFQELEAPTVKQLLQQLKALTGAKRIVIEV